MASNSPLPNGTHTAADPLQISISLPRSPGLAVNVHLTALARTTMLFVSSQSIESTQARPSMGSFVYAMPDRYNSSQPMCTTIYSTTPSIDFATRLARLLARKLNKPCYVGSSISLTTSLGGGTIEEEMEAFRSIVEVVLQNAKAT